MISSQIVTISFFHYTGWSNRWWGFRQMGEGYGKLKNIPGLQFLKLLGSGGINGFSILPDFGVYGMLAVWDSEAPARTFFDNHPQVKAFRDHAHSMWTIYLQTTMAHGRWEKQSPFEITQTFDPKEPLAVLTRATIRTRHLFNFWRRVPSVSRSIADKPGLLFSVGIGELPIVQQATFSLWENSEQMMNYAYKSPLHKKVIQRTRALGWYKEELFARFRVVASEGTWPGVDMGVLSVELLSIAKK